MCLGGWDGFMSGYFVLMAGPCICTSKVHPVFNPVIPYQYRLPNLYLSVVDIANACVWCCFMRNSASHPVGLHGRLSENS